MKKSALIFLALMPLAAIALYLGGQALVEELARRRSLYMEEAEYYAQVAREEERFILENQDPSGAFVQLLEEGKTSTVVPYFSNLAALALLEGKPGEEEQAAVKRHLQWIFRHLNRGDQDPVNGEGTIYDYQIVRRPGSPPQEISKKKYDSADAYAASSLILLRRYVESSGDLAFLEEEEEAVLLIMEALLRTMDEDGLSMTDNSGRLKYTLDNVEVNQGLKDSSWLLEEGYGQVRTARERKLLADLKGALESNSKAIEARLWNREENRYEVGYDGEGRLLDFNGLEEFYPSAVVQLFPMIFGVEDPGSRRSKTLYQDFCETWKWEKMAHRERRDSSFYWGVLAYAGALMRDEERTDAYLENYLELVAEDRGYPLYITEAAWVARSARLLEEDYRQKIRFIDPFGWFDAAESTGR